MIVATKNGERSFLNAWSMCEYTMGVTFQVASISIHDGFIVKVRSI